MGDWTLRDDGTWHYDPDLPTPVTAADYDPHATRFDLPAVEGRVEYAGHVDYIRPDSTHEPPEPIAATAGVEDHSEPWVYAGSAASAPTNETGSDLGELL